MNTLQAGTAVERWRALECHRSGLSQFVFWLVRERLITNDIVQTVMGRVCLEPSMSLDHSSLQMRLFTEAVREHLRLVQVKGNIPPELFWRASDARQGLDSEIEIGSVSTLRCAILEMTDDHRLPLVMQMLGGFEPDDIAEVLNLPARVVYRRLSSAREQLRAQCDPYGREKTPAEGLA